MSGIFQGDIIIKTMIELGIEDMRKNPWLIDHMLEDLTSINYFSSKYGQKQVDACKEWLANNQIDVYMVGRSDKDRYPCVTIAMGPSPEKGEMKTMGDQSTETTLLLPNKIGKPISYVVKPFTPTGYDSQSGEVSLDPSTKGLDGVVAGMILVDPSTGNGYKIEDIGPGFIVIESNLNIKTTQLAVVPQYQYYEARIEHTFFQETYRIGCHVHGDTQPLLWLHSIVLYAILRYRESLLEANGFAESSVSNSDLSEDDHFTGPGGEQVFTRSITLTGQVENSWIKSPRRFIESVVFKDKDSKGFTGGIKILSNLDAPDFMDNSDESLITVEDDDSES